LAVVQTPTGGRVIGIGLDGSIRRQLPTPNHEAYRSSPFVPTAVVIDDPSLGGTGDIWVADGYGASLVHRFRSDGAYISSLTGEDGAGRFRQPHSLFLDRRNEPELYVADRQNGRIQVFDLDGVYRGVIGVGELIAPSFMTTSRGQLFVTDLLARRITVFDRSNRFAGHLFPNALGLRWGHPRVTDGWPDAWPNSRATSGAIERPILEPGSFHSPHGIAADSRGDLYITEFVLGGRTIKLQRL
jgi:hypothetical protein